LLISFQRKKLSGIAKNAGIFFDRALFEIALVFMRLDHVVSRIVNTDHDWLPFKTRRAWRQNLDTLRRNCLKTWPQLARTRIQPAAY
jgi:hypothetical protein